MADLRTLIIGGPKVGKTTMARRLAASRWQLHLCTDPQRMCPPGVIGTPDELDWEGTSSWVAEHWIGRGHTIVEGVAVVRALRKWREAHPDAGLPYDELIHLKQPHAELTKAQLTMAKGHDTILKTLDWI